MYLTGTGSCIAWAGGTQGKDWISKAEGMGWALWMRSGAFRALQVCEREEQRSRTPVPWNLGLLCHPCSCLPMEHPRSCKELIFHGALLPSSLQMQPETVENPGEWCRCITKWDYCRLVLCCEQNLPVQMAQQPGSLQKNGNYLEF